MHAIRLAKILCLLATGLNIALVAFGNLTDYGTNFKFVTEVLELSDVPADSHIHWRALPSPVVHHAVYLAIIATEVLVAALILSGSMAMAFQLRAPPPLFQKAKDKALLGLALGFVLYEGGFVAIGGEWFGMWQAPDFDAVQSAFRTLITFLGLLIFVSLKDADPTEE